MVLLDPKPNFTNSKAYSASIFQVYSLNLQGHGGNPTTDRAFQIEDFAEQVLDFMASEHLVRASFFGYSMGGYIALYLSLNQPEKVDRIFTLATKFGTGIRKTAAREVKMLNPEKDGSQNPLIYQLS